MELERSMQDNQLRTGRSDRKTPATRLIRGSLRRSGNQTAQAVRIDLSAAVDLAAQFPVEGGEGGNVAEQRRRLLAAVCKVFGDHLPSSAGPGEEFGLPPRLRQTLKHLVHGDSEKQVAYRLGLSQHTIHVYVKQLYKRLNVSSRGELLAKFVRGSGGR